MARYSAIAAAAKSLERLLTKRLSLDDPVGGSVRAVLVHTDEFGDLGARQGAITRPVLTVFLARVEVNRVMRPGWSAVGAVTDQVHLPLDLYFLLTPWAANAEHEQLILGSAMRCLEETPILAGPLLDTTHAPNWAADDAVHVTPGALEADDIMRIWDTLSVEYRLTVPYLARIVRIDAERTPSAPPVLTAIAGATPSLEP